MRRSPARALVTAAAATFVTERLLVRLIESPAWTRTNFRGQPVTLHGGAAASLGGLAGGLVSGAPPGRWAIAAVLGSATLAGAYDDFLAHGVERSDDKGWRGHVRALRAGRVSGGAVKVAVIGAGALAAAGPTSSTRTGRLTSAALIAGSANLINLFDLRPGRAGKVVLMVAAALVGGPAGGLAAAAAGAAAAELPGDLTQRRMLGDLGANPLGALIGLRLAAGGPVLRAAALAIVLGLTAASERVSFSRVIAGNPLLRRVDDWGRAPVPSLP